MEIILATRNPSKAHQIQALFSGSDIRVKTQVEVGIEGEALEDGDTLEANANKKVAYVHSRLPKAWVMADDTGIFIDVLKGEPGVHAAYWGGESLDTEGRMRYCLNRLAGIGDRRATFRTVVVLMAPTGEIRTFVGEVQGRILEAPQAAPQPKMPYSSIFLPDGESLTWAQMAVEYENRISHRGKAFAQAKAFLRTAAP